MATDYSDYEFLKVEVADRVATITINRPDSSTPLTTWCITSWSKSGSTCAPMAEGHRLRSRQRESSVNRLQMAESFSLRSPSPEDIPPTCGRFWRFVRR